MAKKYEDQGKRKRFCVMTRLTEAEMHKLDEYAASVGLLDRSALMRETTFARIAGATAALPEDASKATVQLSEAVGVWRALGPEFNPVVVAGLQGAPVRKPAKVPTAPKTEKQELAALKKLIREMPKPRSKKILARREVLLAEPAPPSAPQEDTDSAPCWLHQYSSQPPPSMLQRSHSGPNHFFAKGHPSFLALFSS